MCNLEILAVLIKCLLQFIKPSSNSTFSCINISSIGLKYHKRVRLGLSHLREHRFKHSFLDSLNPIYSYGSDTEYTCQHLLHCPTFVNERATLLDTLPDINVVILGHNVITIVRFFFCNDPSKTISPII